MTIFSEFAPHRSRLPLLNAQTFAFEQLVCIHSVTADLRWAMVELAWRSLTGLCALARGQLVSWARNGMKSWREPMRERATRTDKPMKPQVFAEAIGERFRDDAIVSCDSGTIATWWARHIPARRGQMRAAAGIAAADTMVAAGGR